MFVAALKQGDVFLEKALLILDRGRDLTVPSRANRLTMIMGIVVISKSSYCYYDDD